MKNLKFLLVVALCFGAISTVSAQITEGEPSAKTIRTGNRPGKGCFGFYLGATSDMLKGAIDKNVKFKALPLLNLKYLSSDHVEWRLGLELYQSSETLSGDIIVENATSNKKERFGESSAMLYPGFAYHFSRHNILDVYAGVEIPFGWNSANLVSEGSDGSASWSSTQKKSSFVIGVGAFVGLQAFIANLPLAIGLEYGISSRFDSGLKYKTVSIANNTTQISYSPDYTQFSHLKSSNDNYARLKAKKGAIGNQVRLTLSYYFK